MIHRSWHPTAVTTVMFWGPEVFHSSTVHTTHRFKSWFQASIHCVLETISWCQIKMKACAPPLKNQSTDLPEKTLSLCVAGPEEPASEFCTSTVSVFVCSCVSKLLLLLCRGDKDTLTFSCRRTHIHTEALNIEYDSHTPCSLRNAHSGKIWKMWRLIEVIPTKICNLKGKGI